MKGKESYTHIAFLKNTYIYIKIQTHGRYDT